MVVGGRLTNLEPAVAEIEDGVNNDGVDFRHVDDACAEHIAVEDDRGAGVGYNEERRQAGRTMRDTVGCVIAVCSDGFLSFFGHVFTIKGRRNAGLEDSRQLHECRGMTGDSRGILYPASLPRFSRLPSPEGIAALVRWFWIAEWDIAPGRTSRQHVISFPASNLTVEPAFVGFAGPTSRRSTRDLTGGGWTVGALLRPAAVPHFTDAPAAHRDAYGPVQFPRLHAAVVHAMTGSEDATGRHLQAAEAFTSWFVENVPTPGEEGLRANMMADLIDTDSSTVRLDDVAGRLGVSARTAQRLAARYVGLSPAAMIRRRRIQEASERLRNDPDSDIATVAADFGYSDQAHLANDFRTVLGLTPGAYRNASSEHSPLE